MDSLIAASTPIIMTRCPSCALSTKLDQKQRRSSRSNGKLLLFIATLFVLLISSATATTDSSNYSNAEFINGFANSIRRIPGGQLVALSRSDPFQLQFRTACPSSNLIYNDNFMIFVNAEGNLVHRNEKTNVTKELLKNRVNDGQWHSLVFNGSVITIETVPAGDQDGMHETARTVSITDEPTDNELSHQDILHFFDGFVGCVRIASSAEHHHGSGAMAAHLQAPHSSAGGGSGGDEIDAYDEFGHGQLDDPLNNGSEGNISNLFQLFHAFPACTDLNQDLIHSHPCHGESFVFCQKCKGQCSEVTTESGKQNTCNCSNGGQGIYCDVAKMELAEPGRIAVRPSIEPDSELANTSARGHPRSGNVNGITENVAVEGSSVVTTQMTPLAPPPASAAALPPPCPCRNGGVCSNTTDGLPCQCPLDYEGDLCETNPHECSEAVSCMHGICHPQDKKCYCTPGYTGNYCEVDINECISSPCEANSTLECKDLVNRYACVCVPGFTSKHCEINIDECASNPCENGATCVDQVNSYSCHCVPGFDGVNCEINIDECADDGTGPKCYNNGSCIDKINGFDCNCGGTGFEGARCENNIDDCLPANCQHGGICIDKILGYECQCHPGYDGYNCAMDVNECDHEQMLMEVNPETSRSPCVEGECFELSNESLYHPKYWGTRDIPEVFNRTFSYANASGYYCYCPPGFAGSKCEIDLNECELPGGGSPCVRGKCVDGRNNYTCECPPGYEGRNCSEEIDECLSSPCVQGTCEDKEADFKCHCPEGFGAKDCSVVLTGCSLGPCLNNGTCHPYYENGQHNFTCYCPPGFSGHICETVTTMSFNGTNYVTVSSNDENYMVGKYEMQFRFRTTLSNVLVAVGQGITYFMLTLSDGKLNLQSSLLNSLNGISSGTNLSNAEWHKVWISVNDTHIALAANLEQTIHPISENQESPVDTGFNMTVLGGATPTLNFLNKENLGFFVGCVQDVIINGVPVHAEVKNNNNITLNNGVLKGCPRKEQCKPQNPCNNGGLCTDLWQKYQCACPRPFLGRRCEYQYEPATFGGENSTTSIVEVKIPQEVSRKFSNSFDISMFVRTRKSSGTIFFLGEESRENGLFLEAQVMDDGQLAVVSKLDEVKEDSYTVDGHQINDGIPHLINVQKEKGLVKISINGSEHFRKSVKDKVAFNPTVMFIGGVIPSDVPAEAMEFEDSTVLPGVEAVTKTASAGSLMARMKPFKGVIQDVRVNLSATDIPPNASTHDHFIVEFFPLNIPINFSMGQPLGNVTLHGEVLKGIVSDFTCSSNPCLNGGTCEVTWNDFKCHCRPDVYDGKTCDVMLRCAMVSCPKGSTCRNIGADGFECISDAAFDGRGSSIPHYKLRAVDVEPIKVPNISFRYRSQTGGSVLYLASHNASIRVATEYEASLRAGTQNRSNFVSVYLNSERNYVRIDNALDGNWHKVELSISTANSLMLGFDSQPKQRIASDVSPHLFQEIVNENDPQIIVGSHIRDGSQYDIHVDDPRRQSNLFNHPETLHDAFFRGCLGDVKLGNYQLPFVSPEQLYAINSENTTLVETTAPTAFYMETGSQPPRLECVLCYNNECMNGGSCEDPNESYDCHCNDGFQGSLCETDIDECVGNKCAHSSRCVDKVANYTCDCPKGYTNWLCDEDLDECEEAPCKNDGICINLDADQGFYQCNCTEDYHGTNCEKRKLSTCQIGNEPCENGAICKPVPLRPDGLSFVCECPQGYEGILCDTRIDHCKDVICANGGTCHNALIGYQCDCMPGWVGPKCEMNRDECAIELRDGQLPCANGGICIDGINEFRCDCKGTGFTGENCDIDIDECESPSVRSACSMQYGKVCVNLPGKYECRCPEELCGTECTISNPCKRRAENETCMYGECIPMCEDDPNKWVCKCDDGYTGEFCSSVLRVSREQSLDLAVIIIPIVAAFLLAIVIAALVLIKMARKKRATRGVYSPSQQEYCNPRVELDNVLKPPPEERLI